MDGADYGVFRAPSLRFAVIICVTLLGSRYSCSALVGETYAQVTARYGQPVDSVIGEQQYTYESNDLKIVVTFVNKISQSEAYFPLNEAHKFTAKEAGMLLGANTDGKVGFTKKNDGATLCDNFYSDDGRLCAIIIKSGALAGRLIQVCSRKWMDSL